MNRTEAGGPIRVGLLGGTFDPIHIGHLRLGIEAIERFALDQVRLVLSSVPPHKEPSLVTTWEKRWRMLELACADNEKLMPSSIEMDRPGPSYTVDTLRQVRSDLRDEDELFLLVGMDAAHEMKTWKSYSLIPSLARVLVATRGGGKEMNEIGEFGNLLEYFELPKLDVSSTRIRSLVREGRDISHLVPCSVHQYIQEEGLYLENRASPSTSDHRTRSKEKPI